MVKAETNLEKFLSSKQFESYEKKNPESAKEISEFLRAFIIKYQSIPGVDVVFKRLADETKGNSSELKWFNIFSQIRCTNFLLEKGFKINRLEAEKNGSVLDIKFINGKYCDIKSFLPRERDNVAIGWSQDEIVIKKFAEEKIQTAFLLQGADTLVIDDIFSENGSKYRFLSYFFGFIKNKASSRFNIMIKHMDIYLPRMIVVRFVNSISKNPKIVFKGELFNA